MVLVANGAVGAAGTPVKVGEARRANTGAAVVPIVVSIASIASFALVC